MHLTKLLTLTVGLASLAGLGTLRAQIFTEVGDAGQTPGTVQPTGLTQSGTNGQSVTILGNFSGANDADIFSLNLTDLTMVTFSTVNAVTLNGGNFPGAGGGLDTQLFLFTSTGLPVYANNDAPGGNTLQSTLPQGTSFTASLSPGLYYLAISLSDNNPVNTSNQTVFATATASTDVVGPAGGLNPATFSNFNGLNTFADSGNYQINITTVPEPSTWVLSVLGATVIGATLSRRRRQAQTSAL